MLNKFNERYQDRGTIKWLGMYLSEHTASMDADKSSRSLKILQKKQMNFLEIATILDSALIKNQAVSIQLEEIDTDGNYLPDITGKIEGYEDSGIWIDNTHIAYEEIRNISLYTEIKWSAFEKKKSKLSY